MFAECYRNRRVLLTGHTGFKGSWMALWLETLGAQVTCVALPPYTTSNHWDLLKLPCSEHHIDIRNADALRKTVLEVQPEIVFHLAAQSLVRDSYRDPLTTWSTNVMGTVNLLEACRNIPALRAVVVVTTDKCYENKETTDGYKETDRLGGHDPYSASKASAELVAASYRDAFFNTAKSPLLATARAGNVIGGGDWSEDRLIPDIVRAMNEKRSLEIRMPNAMRPWQHILEPLAGYLQLGQMLLEGKKEYAEAWNLGPNTDSNHTVSELLEHMQHYWPTLSWHNTATSQPHETTVLQLDSNKAHARLKWRTVLTFEQQLAMTAEWYNAFQQGNVISKEQLRTYLDTANKVGCTWC